MPWTNFSPICNIVKTSVLRNTTRLLAFALALFLSGPVRGDEDVRPQRSFRTLVDTSLSNQIVQEQLKLSNRQRAAIAKLEAEKKSSLDEWDDAWPDDDLADFRERSQIESRFTERILAVLDVEQQKQLSRLKDVAGFASVAPGPNLWYKKSSA